MIIFKKTVTDITLTGITYYIICPILHDNDGTTERQLKKDYHRH